MNNIKIATYNILSYLNIFHIVGSFDNEKEENYIKRYNKSIDEINNLMNTDIDIICLQDVDDKFLELLKTLLINKEGNKYWFHKTTGTISNIVLFNIQKCSYRTIPFKTDNLIDYNNNAIQLLLVHKHFPENSFYIANLNFSIILETDKRKEIINDVIKSFMEYSNIHKPIMIFGSVDFINDKEINDKEINKKETKNFIYKDKLKLQYYDKLLYPNVYIPYTIKDGNIIKNELTKHKLYTLLYTPSTLYTKYLKLIKENGILETPYDEKGNFNELWGSNSSINIYDIVIKNN